MKTSFGILPDGREASLYTISCSGITAKITDFGATLVQLYVPDRNGRADDVVLGYDDANGYRCSTSYFGATVGRGANRLDHATFTLNGVQYHLPKNDGEHNLHSGPDGYSFRLWEVTDHKESSISFRLESPHGDQGYPGNAVVRVCYTLTPDNALHITYDAICDRDTVFNLTNHSYFNLAGHNRPEKAMEQILSMPARHFTPDDAENIPTGELRSVAGTPMDFRSPKPIGRDINTDYDALQLQGGYDHNFEVFTDPCAILSDAESGRIMTVSTDLCGVQFYSGNFLDGEPGKDGAIYTHRAGICLETQFYPDALHHPEWKQPITHAGEKFHTETVYRFSAE